MNPLTQFKTTPRLLTTLTLLCFGLLPKAQAVVPPPGGGYPNLNTAEGQKALFSLTTGVGNAAVGWYSLFSNTDGSLNTGVGTGTLLFNIGDQTTGEGTRNTAIGTAALLFNTTGAFNTAVGTAALLNNTSGNFNTAIGPGALNSNSTGVLNTANGANALNSNSTGSFNTAIGQGALNSNSTGNYNTALGFNAGGLLTIGGNNIYIGFNVFGEAGESNTIRIGGPAVQTATFIAGISGQTAADGVAVYVNSDGKLGTLTSSARFKTEIKPMDESSQAVLALKPVTFRYKHEIDPKGIPQFGLVAEEVEKVNPDLVARDAKGEIYTVRYEAVNAMLLNEFLKEHRTVQEQKAIVAQLKQDFQSRLAEQQQQIEALTVGLQRVSAQLETSKPAPQVVNNP
jgi:Chaperone of endosialidase